MRKREVLYQEKNENEKENKRENQAMKIQECASQILLNFELAVLIRKVDQRRNQKGTNVERKQNNLS